jgi:hypothetical protein
MLAVPISEFKPATGLAGDVSSSSSSSSSSVRLYQPKQQLRWKLEELSAELQQQQRGGAASTPGDPQQQLSAEDMQALRMQLLGLERQPHLCIAVQLLHEATGRSVAHWGTVSIAAGADQGPAANATLAAADSAADNAAGLQHLLLARQVSFEPRVWQRPGKSLPTWAAFTVRLKVAVLVAALNKLIQQLASLAAMQQQQQQKDGEGGASGMEQQKREQRRLKRQAREQQQQQQAAVSEVPQQQEDDV